MIVQVRQKVFVDNFLQILRNYGWVEEVWDDNS